MWNRRQNQVRDYGKDKREEAIGGQEEVQLKIKVSNEGEAPESLEDLTDDEVFKELINIVVDVFSHKSEKCLLTFELPSQSDRLATVSCDSSCASVSECFDKKIGEKVTVSDILIPLKSVESIPSRKSSHHERTLKLPINKPSKHSNKKRFDKRLNPIVQTVLHAKQGFTDLETLFKLRHQSAYRGRWQQGIGNERQRPKEESGEEQNTGKEWERQREVTEVPTSLDHMMKLGEEQNVKQLSPQLCSDEDFEDSNRRSNVYNQLNEVIYTLKMLRNMYDENSHPDLHRIEYHISEIKTHMSAIRSYLFSGSSDQASSLEVNGDMPYSGAEKVGTLISRTKKKRKDVTLYRIATKKSFTRRSSSRCGRKNRKNNSNLKAVKIKQVDPKKKDEADMNLGDILKCYQEVKREETELVKVLLSRLGLANVERKQPHHSQTHGEHHKDGRVSGRSCQTSEGLNEVERERIQISRTVKNRRLKNPECGESAQKHKNPVEQKIEVEDLSTVVKEPRKSLKRGIRTKICQMNGGPQDDRMNNRKRQTKCSKPTSSIQEKRRESNETNEGNEDASCFTPETSMNQFSDEVFVQPQGDICTMPLKEEKVMSRIQNAAERLEHMQDLVEKKLDYLCKQKEYYQEMKSSLLTSNFEQEQPTIEKEEPKIHEESAMKKRGSNSTEQSNESQNEVYELPEASHTTTMKTVPSYVRYTNVNLEESKDFREILKGFEEATSNPKFKNRKTKSFQLSEAVKDAPEDQLLGNTYICNYMMEMRDCEVTDSQEANTCTSQIQLVSRVGSSVVVNDCDNQDQVSDREDSTHERHDGKLLEVNQDDNPTFKEPSVNMYESSTGCEKYKVQPSVRKKLSGSNFPRKSWCTVS